MLGAERCSEEVNATPGLANDEDEMGATTALILETLHGGGGKQMSNILPLARAAAAVRCMSVIQPVLSLWASRWRMKMRRRVFLSMLGQPPVLTNFLSGRDGYPILARRSAPFVFSP